MIALVLTTLIVIVLIMIALVLTTLIVIVWIIGKARRLAPFLWTF